MRDDVAHRLLAALKKEIARNKVLEEIRKGKDAPVPLKKQK